MRKVQEVLRLLLVCGLSQRQASRVSGMGRASVAEYLVRAQKAGLLETREWESLSREDLEQRLYPPPPAATARHERPEVGWQEVHEELRGKGMTLSLIWEEYRERCPEGVPVQPVLRAVPGVEGQAGPVDAPVSPRRGEAVCGLLRGHGLGGRRWAGAAGTDLCGGVGCE